MKKIIWILIGFVILNACKTTKINQNVFDKNANQTILLGETNRSGLLSEPYNIWFLSNYETYQVDIESLEALNKDAFSKSSILKLNNSLLSYLIILFMFASSIILHIIFNYTNNLD